MTLPEVLIVVSVMGVLAVVVSAAITVSFRTVKGAEGRTNVARAEQSIDTWLPADLASTDVNDTALPAVDTDPNASPCGNCGTIDLGGVNALQLAWRTMEPGSPPVEKITTVQYQYIKVGDEWQMQRIKCFHNDPCTMRIVLHDLAPPPFADEAAWLASPTHPDWAMGVSVPNDPAALNLSSNARRILVTIDGGGGTAGAGGGSNSVSLTAGGTTTSNIAADDFTVPAFVRAKSRCGGPVALIVDDSGSIGSTAVKDVIEPGVRDFIEAFRGTPTQLMIVPFASTARVAGTSNWHDYVDMTDDAAVDALYDLFLEASPNRELNQGGGTNWEDAFFRIFHNEDGTQAATMPNRVVFFTDGFPTFDRLVHRTGDPLNTYLQPYSTAAGWKRSVGYEFNQEAWDRADAILDQPFGRGSIEMVFVGVGPALPNNIERQYSTTYSPWPLGWWVDSSAAQADPNNPPPGSSLPKTGVQALEHLLVGAPDGATEAIWDSTPPGEFTNTDTADFYLINQFNADKFGAAMKAAALKDCGGTLTIQTKQGGSNVPQEFIYENTRYEDDAGTLVSDEPRRVTTSQNFQTGTFDFEIPGSSAYFVVEIMPQELETLTGYAFDSWSCSSAGTPKVLGTDMHLIDITDSNYKGISVSVYPNEAVSCVMSVT